MAKNKKDGQFFNCYLKKELCDKMQAYSDETSLSKTSIVEKALDQYVESVYKKQEDDHEDEDND